MERYIDEILETVLYIIWFIWQYKRIITLFTLAAKPRETEDPINFSNFQEEIDPEDKGNENMMSPAKIDIIKDWDRLSNIAFKEIAEKWPVRKTEYIRTNSEILK